MKTHEKKMFKRNDTLAIAQEETRTKSFSLDLHTAQKSGEIATTKEN